METVNSRWSFKPQCTVKIMPFKLAQMMTISTEAIVLQLVVIISLYNISIFDNSIIGFATRKYSKKISNQTYSTLLSEINDKLSKSSIPTIST